MNFVLLQLFFFMTCFSIWGNEQLDRIALHSIVGDSRTALKEARDALDRFSEDKKLQRAVIKALAANSNDRLALKKLLGWSLENRAPLLEDIAWSTLRTAFDSASPIARVFSLIGAVMTQDANALPFLRQALRDPNSFIRTVAATLAPQLGDRDLNSDLLNRLSYERVWHVRVELLRSLGKLRREESRVALESFLRLYDSSQEEIAAAIAALINLFEKPSEEEIHRLASASRYGFRVLACELIGRHGLKEFQPILEKALKDSHFAVRATAIKAFAVLNIHPPLVRDTNPVVAITAAWAQALYSPSCGQKKLKAWLSYSNSKVRRLASVALAKTASQNPKLAIEEMQKNRDPFVRLNLAVGLFSQRIALEESSQVIKEFLDSEKGPVIWREDVQGLFEFIDQNDQPFNAGNQATRLELLAMLATVRFTGIQQSIEQFLEESRWELSGDVTSLLLKEGSSAVVPMIEEMVMQADDKKKLQAALVLAIMHHSKKAVSVLKELYPKSNRDEKIQILEALGWAADKEAIPFLIDAMQSPFASLRVVAAATLLQALRR